MTVRISRPVLAGVVAGAVLLVGACTAESSSSGASSGSFTAASPEMAQGAVPDAARAAAPAAPAQAPESPISTERSLVRTAQLSLDVDDPVVATRKVRAAVAGVGGTVAQEQSGDDTSRLTLRVPAAALDRLIDDVAAFGHPTGRSAQVVDATDQVIDLNARVASQQASVVRVRTLLGQAKSIGDIVSIESELSRREADLDSLTGRLAALKDQVALSTLTVDITRVATPPVQAAGTSGFLAGLGNGWEGLQALGSATGAVVGFLLPFLPVLALLAGVGWLGRRVLRSRHPVPAVAGGRSGPGSEGES